MIRNLKTLGLALVAAFALSAVLASAASAEFTFDEAASTLTAKGVSPTQKFVITDSEGEEEGKSTCEEVGVGSGGTGLGTVESEITIEPVYSEDCTLSLGEATFEAEVDANGCHYLFTTETLNAVHIICSNEEGTEAEGKSIEITAKILGSYRQCIKIHAQTPTEPTIHYDNKTNSETGKMDVLMTVTVKGITYEKVGLCKGEVNESNNADYEGEVTVTGSRR